MKWLVGWLAAFAILVLRASCRIRLHGDPRPQLRSEGHPYIYCVLHAHQVAAVLDGEPGTGAMVSQSADGGIIVPALRVRGIVPVRGSSSDGHDKGGRAALEALIDHVRGGRPAYLAVDGPRGPRGRVHKGIALLSKKTGAAVVTIVPVPSRRWILRGAWDRMQIPKPLSTIDAYFGPPVLPRPGESLDGFRARIEETLRELEREHDPEEAAVAQAATVARSERKARAQKVA